MSRIVGHIGIGRRMSRRAIVRGGIVSGAALVGAGALAGCASAPAAPAAATTAPAAPAAAAPAATPTAQPKYGGTLRYNQIGRPPHLDLHLTNTSLLVSGPGAAYGRLIAFKYGADVPMGAFIPA